jgi:hypothetical protein
MGRIVSDVREAYTLIVATKAGELRLQEMR